MIKPAEFCARCNWKLEDGVSTCPGCGASLTRKGSFIELGGWVIVLISLIPIVMGVKVVDQHYFLPLIGGLVLVGIGVFLVIYGRLQKSGAADPVKIQRRGEEKAQEPASRSSSA